MGLLEETLALIAGLDTAASAAARERQDQLTKPAGSLGMLEEISVRVAGITSVAVPRITDKVVIVMAGDHGVVAQGVSAYPPEVTPQMVCGFLAGTAAINIIARHFGIRTTVVDLGVAVDIQSEGLVVKKIGHGTADLSLGPAMTRAQAVAALEAGIEVANAEIDAGATLVGTGDMGIGNTTPSSAIVSAITGTPVGEVTGTGTGITDGQRLRKASVIERGLGVNHPDPSDGIDVLAKVGGFEIGGIAGVILGCAARRVPVVIDGFISGAGALIAATICPVAREFMIASHVSAEPGHRIALEHIALSPALHMDMRLGEGTGAAMAMSLVEVACEVLAEMSTFAEAGVSTKND